jgi:flagellar biosynthetic protein FliS
MHSSMVLLAELRGSLDIEKGGALTQNLGDLHEYMTRCLVHANLNSDSASVDEVLGCSGKFAPPGPPLVRK